MSTMTIVEELTMLSHKEIQDWDDEELRRFEYLCFMWTDLARRELVARSRSGGRQGGEYEKR